ncbi:MAG: hypothetical protein WCW54_03335, partial [Candidatus Paceibacterota bacterium]
MQSLKNVISLNQAAKISGYTQDYLGYLIRSGEIKGVKKGGIWFTTEEEITHYISKQKAIKRKLLVRDFLEKVSTKKLAVRDFVSHLSPRNFLVSSLVLFVAFSSTGFYFFKKYDSDLVPHFRAPSFVLASTAFTSKIKNISLPTFPTLPTFPKLSTFPNPFPTLKNIGEVYVDGVNNAREAVESSSRNFAIAKINSIKEKINSAKEFGGKVIAVTKEKKSGLGDLLPEGKKISAAGRSITNISDGLAYGWGAFIGGLVDNGEDSFSKTKELASALGSSLVSSANYLSENSQIKIDTSSDLASVGKIPVAGQMDKKISRIRDLLPEGKSISEAGRSFSQTTASVGSSLSNVSGGVSSGWGSFIGGIINNAENSANRFSSGMDSITNNIRSSARSFLGITDVNPKIYIQEVPVLVKEIPSAQTLSPSPVGSGPSVSRPTAIQKRDVFINQYDPSVLPRLAGIELAILNNINHNTTQTDRVYISSVNNVGSAIHTVTQNGTLNSPTLNDSTFANFTSTGVSLFNRVPTLAHAFTTWPSGTSNASNASLYINPSSSVANGNLIGASVADVVKFIVDAEGNIYANSLVLTGSVTSGATTVASLSVLDNAIIGDAGTDTLTVNSASTFNNNISQVGAYTFSTGTGAVSLNGPTTILGTTLINSTGTSATSIGNSTGVLTLASGGASGWTNTSGDLTIQTATSGTTTLDSAGILNLGTVNSTATNLGKSATTLTINPTSWTATPTISGLITATSGLTSNGAVTIQNNSNLVIASGTGTFTQTYTGTTGAANSITATGVTSGNVLLLTSSSATASGDVLAIANSGTGKDISGTSNTWNISKAGAGTFTSISSGSGAISGGAGSFTTLTSSGASTIGTGASLTNTFGSGASSINTIGSATTPGALTLHGATTLDNTFTVSGANLTTLGGNLTVTGTAWTATPTISGLITATSGMTATTGNITATAGNVAITAGLLSLNGVTRISNAGVGTFITGTVIGSQTFTTNNIADSGALTISSAPASPLTINSGTTGTLTLDSGTTGSILIGTNVNAKTITIGNGVDDTFSLNSSGFNVSSLGALSGITTLNMSGQLTSTLASGTAPLVVASNTLVTNLNADLLDGQHGAYYATASGYIPYTGGTTNVDLGIHNLTVDTNSLFVDATNHRVGVGTTAPGYDGAGYGAIKYLSVYGSTGTSLEIAGNTTTNDGFISSLDFINTANAGTAGAGRYGIAAIRGYVTNADSLGTDGGGYLTFATKADGGSSAERMRITSAGNVGIGTTGPLSALSIGGVGSASYKVSIATTLAEGLVVINSGTNANNYAIDGEATGAGTTNVGGYFSASGATNNYGLIVAAGSVGIGTTAPGSALEVNGVIHANTANSSDALRLSSTTGTNASYMTFNNTSGKAYVGLDSSTGAIFGNGNYSFNIFTPSTKFAVSTQGAGGTPAFVIDTSGNVGIGTTGPEALFHVLKSTTSTNIPVQIGILGMSTTGIAAAGLGSLLNFQTEDDAGSMRGGGGFGSYWKSAANAAPQANLYVEDNAGTDIMTWQYGGNVGIGTTAPYGKLDVKVGTSAQGKYWNDATSGVVSLTTALGRPGAGFGSFNSVGNTYDSDLIFYNMFYPGSGDYAWTERMRIRSDGNVGIGTVAPTSLLTLQGNTPTALTGTLAVTNLSATVTGTT